MRNAVFTIALALGMLPLAGAGARAADANGVTISHPWARATPGGSTISAAFLEIKSEAGDKLVSASSPVAGRVEVHTHIMEGDVMKMRRVDALDIDPVETPFRANETLVGASEVGEAWVLRVWV